MSQIKNKNKIIGFDLDGVIMDFSSVRMKVLKEFGIVINPEQTPSDIVRDLVPREIMGKLQYLIYSDLKTSLLPELMEGAREALESVKKSGTPYFLISRRKNPDMAKKLLKKRGLWPDYFNEKNAFFVLSPEDKNKKAEELGVTHYLDDEMRVLDALLDVQHRMLFDQFGVRNDVAKYPRIFSWEAFLKRIDLE